MQLILSFQAKDLTVVADRSPKAALEQADGIGLWFGSHRYNIRS